MRPSSAAIPTSCANSCPACGAKNPAATSPHSPDAPCTAIAPEGSSMEIASSNTSTSSGVKKPATAPAKMASAGVASAAQAVDVTRPASQPLAQRLASGLPKRNCVTAKVATNAAAAESNVLMAVPGSAASGACSQITAPAAFHASQPTSASRQ